VVAVVTVLIRESSRCGEFEVVMVELQLVMYIIQLVMLKLVGVMDKRQVVMYNL